MRRVDGASVYVQVLAVAAPRGDAEPMDLDYRALSNAGLCCIGRLQTDADRARVVEGLAGAGGVGGDHSAVALAAVIQGLEPRWFWSGMRKDRDGVRPVMPRYAMCFMKGPMTRWGDPAGGGEGR